MNKYHNYENKYHNYEELSFAQESTKQQVLAGRKLSGGQIENLCTGFLTNAIYSGVVEGDKNFEQGREKSFEIAANVVLKHGEEIAEQLKENDKLATQDDFEDKESEGNEQSASNQNQPNTSKDVKKISGGTMAKIIKKIAEIMAAMSPEEQSAVANNFGSLFAVLGASFDKVGQSMQSLAEAPIVIASIQNMLGGTKGGQVFEKMVEDHLSPEQRQAVVQISEKDLATYRAQNEQERKNSVSFDEFVR